MTLTYWLPFLILAAVIGPAFAIAFKRIGWSPWMGAIVVVPLGFIILLWILALNIPRQDEPDYAEVFGDGDRPHRIRRGDE